MISIDKALLNARYQPIAPDVFGTVFSFAQAVAPVQTAAAWYDLPIGTRDKKLLTIRSHLFGTQCDAVAKCTGCGSTMEYAVNLDAFIALPCDDEVFQIDYGGQRLSFRGPSTRDLMETAGTMNDNPYAALIHRLRLAPERDRDQPVVNDALISAVNTHLEEKLKISDIVIRGRCSECDGQMEYQFDIVQVLYRDVTHAAAQIIEEIHILATWYGWTEEQILSIPRQRRNWYTARVQR